jgi:peptide/nickel transport system permease protein
MTAQAATLQARTVRSQGGPFEFVRRLRRGWLTLVAAAILLGFVLMAIFAPVIAPYSPLEMHFDDRFAPPSREYLFGTDESGRDIFSRVVDGSRITMSVGFGSILLSLLVGLPLGLVAGFVGGRVDSVIMRVLDGLFAFPIIVLALALVAAFGASIPNLVFAIGILLAPRLARITRATVLVQEQRDYVLAARAMGAPGGRMLFRTILPNCLSPIIVDASLSIAIAIKVEASLSFLGLGVQVPHASWGSLLSFGYLDLGRAPWYAIFPGLCIFLVVLSINLVGDGVRDALEPRLRQR